MLIEKALVATDFSEPARQLVNSVEELKAAGLKEVLLMHVVNASADYSILKSMQDNSEQELAKERQKIENLGLEVKTLISVGSPANEITQIAQKEKMDLILIAAHGKGYVKEVLLGSTTFDVVRISEVPVLVEKFKNIGSADCQAVTEEKFKKVLIPTDFSERSLSFIDKLKEAKDIIEEVVLLSVIEWSKSKPEFEEFKDKSYQQLKKLRSEFEELGIKVTNEVRAGYSAGGILAVAEEKDVSLIAMATRGAGTIKGLFIGSTANEVVRKAKQPVLLDPSF
ncbi:universal stress protein [Fuchsiella alkaliacetigena]|uniref:universal stress protein n=1 Tax=Fuchsiella alkaliacetigena TaxID=957042 RepID=UPI00200B3613|nr:universal stress protein [Fuchsiella alkaliacetigena]MCK8823587.1 universal stress protein [Fuchsiella alkaliacetigena]